MKKLALDGPNAVPLDTRLKQLTFVLALLCALVLAFKVVRDVFHVPMLTDMEAYMRAEGRFTRGANPYVDDGQLPFVYAPATLLLLGPLTTAVGRAVYTGLCVVGALATPLAAARLSPRLRPLVFFLGLIGFGCSTWIAVLTGNVSPVLYGVMFLTALALGPEPRSAWLFVAGVAFAGVFKPTFAALLVVVFVLYGLPAFVLAAVAWSGIYLLALGLLGPGLLPGYLHAALSAVNGFSIYSLPMRVLAKFHAGGSLSPLFMGLQALVGLALVLIARLWAVDGRAPLRGCLAFALAVGILLNPRIQVYDMAAWTAVLAAAATAVVADRRLGLALLVLLLFTEVFVSEYVESLALHALTVLLGAGMRLRSRHPGSRREGSGFAGFFLANPYRASSAELR